MIPETIGVVGAGTMGAGIAQLAAQTGARTLIYDPQPPAGTSVPDLVRDPIRTPPGAIRYPIAELEPWQVLVDSAVHLAEEVNRLAGEKLAPQTPARPRAGWLRRHLIDRWR